ARRPPRDSLFFGFGKALQTAAKPPARPNPQPQPSSAFCFQKSRRRTRRRVRASIRFSKRAPSSDSPPARPIPPKYVRRLHISHLRAPVPVSSLPPYTNPQIE